MHHPVAQLAESKGRVEPAVLLPQGAAWGTGEATSSIGAALTLVEQLCDQEEDVWQGYLGQVMGPVFVL